MAHLVPKNYEQQIQGGTTSVAQLIILCCRTSMSDLEREHLWVLMTLLKVFLLGHMLQFLRMLKVTILDESLNPDQKEEEGAKQGGRGGGGLKYQAYRT